MNLSYGIGSSYYATDVYSPISLGGVDVPKQKIGLVKKAAASYSGKVAGLVGLAYPSLTSEYPGDDPSKDVKCNLNTSMATNSAKCNTKYYSPLISTMFADKLSPPVFSFALSRSDSSGGIMTIGGIPDLHDPQVNVTEDATEVTVPIETLKGFKDYTLYLTTSGAFHYTGAPEGAGKSQFLEDTVSSRSSLTRKPPTTFLPFSIHQGTKMRN